MFARWYTLMLGFLLIVLGIAGLVAAARIPGGSRGLVAISVIWLITALLSLGVGFFVRNISTVRWFAGIVGGLYFLWGIVQLFAAPAAIASVAIASVAGFILLLGSIGLGAALVPANWLHEPIVSPMAA